MSKTVEYMGYTISVKTLEDDMFGAVGTKAGSPSVYSKWFNGSSGQRRAIAHAKRQIEKL